MRERNKYCVVLRILSKEILVAKKKISVYLTLYWSITIIYILYIYSQSSQSILPRAAVLSKTLLTW